MRQDKTNKANHEPFYGVTLWSYTIVLVEVRLRHAGLNTNSDCSPVLAHSQQEEKPLTPSRFINFHFWRKQIQRPRLSRPQETNWARTQRRKVPIYSVWSLNLISIAAVLCFYTISPVKQMG